MGGRRSSINTYTSLQASRPIVSHLTLLRLAPDILSDSALCLHRGFVHGSIHFFVALPISMVQEGLRKRLILPGGQYPDHVLHAFAGPAPSLPFHAIAVEPVIRFCYKSKRELLYHVRFLVNMQFPKSSLDFISFRLIHCKGTYHYHIKD